jgi:hypothetical protein
MVMPTVTLGLKLGDGAGVGHELIKARSELAAQLIPPRKQQVNSRKPQIWQFSNIGAAGDGVIGIRSNDGDGVFACQIDDADQDCDPERNG